jgi:uncharacterized protein (DUF4415 family)
MKQKSTSRKLGSDLNRIDAMRDEDIDTSDIPPIPRAMFAKGIVRRGLKPVVVTQQQLTIRLDSDVLAWLKSQGRDYQTRINEVLRAHMTESQSMTRSR